MAQSASDYWAQNPTAAQNVYGSVNNPSLTSGPAASSPVNPYSATSVNYGASPYAPATTYMDPSTLTPPQSSGYGASSTPTYGTQSGPGIMQQWFSQRASGTDPGWEYATKRAGTSLDNAYAARGMYNSGAALQGQGDMLANMTSQREGQLDALAGGASNEYGADLNRMIGMGTGLANSEAGLGSAYDLGAGNALNTGNAAALQLGTNAAMIPYLAKQGLMQNLFGLGSLGLGALAGG